MGATPKGHPGDHVRDRHVSFIQANMELLAAESYAQYLKHGRGMLVLDDAFVSQPRGHFTKFKLTYMAEGNDVFRAAGNKWPGAKEAGWVKTYSPKEDILIAFVRSDNGISSYRVHGVGAGIPLMAYRRSIGKDN